MKKREEIITIDESKLWINPIATADVFFNENIWVNKLLIVDHKNNLRWLITAKDIDNITRESQSSIKPSRDKQHRLRVGATLHMFRTPEGQLDKKRILQYVDELVEKWIDVVAVSSAHWHTESIGEMVQLVRKSQPTLTIIAWNVTSAEGVEFLKNKWADTIKIGQWPWSICTTREVAGVGIPQMTALYVCSQAAKIVGAKIIADGWISKSGDIVKALTLADAIMAGGIFAWAQESPWEIFEFKGEQFKVYRGMWSHEAMKDGSAARYGHTKDKVRKLTSEGIVGMKPIAWPISDIIKEYRGWVQSGMWYLWAKDLKSLRKNARYIKMTPAGQKESAPHDITQLKKS